MTSESDNTTLTEDELILVAVGLMRGDEPASIGVKTESDEELASKLAIMRAVVESEPSRAVRICESEEERDFESTRCELLARDRQGVVAAAGAATLSTSYGGSCDSHYESTDYPLDESNEAVGVADSQLVSHRVTAGGTSSRVEPITKRQEVCRVAAELFRQSPDWVTFFREVLGVEGVARRVFSNPEEMEAFEQTGEYAEIQGMVAKLRERSRSQTESNEPTRVITLRLPKSLHESLKAESHQRRTSINQLCISKLLQIIDGDLVPSD